MALGDSKPHPFRHFVPLSPLAGTAFGLVVAQTKRLPERGAGTALAVTEGLRQAKSCELIYNPSGFRSRETYLPFQGRLLGRRLHKPKGSPDGELSPIGD